MALKIRNDEQVSDVFHVDLKEADCHSKHSLVRILFNVVENVLYSTWHNTKLILCGRLLLFSLVQFHFRRQRRLLLLSIEIAFAAKNRMRLS